MMDNGGVVFAFYVLSALTLVSAGGVMVSRNLFHAVLFLILTFVGMAGFFVLLSADFIAMAQIIIYVGAIAVLVLFAILLTPRAGRDNGETRFAAPAALLSVCVAAIFIFVIHDTAWQTNDVAPRPQRPGAGSRPAQHMGPALRTRERPADCCTRWRNHARPLARRRSGGCARMTIELEHFLTVSALIFAIGLAVALSKRNAIGVLMGVELMLNAVNLTLISFSRFTVSDRPITGQTFAVFIITVAAAEAAVALALAVSVYRNRDTVDVDQMNLLRS